MVRRRGLRRRPLDKHEGRAGDSRPALGVLRPLLGCRRSEGDDVDDATLATYAELHVPGHQSEQRVVAAPAHAAAGVEVGAALSDEDLARVDQLAAEAL